jgi:hypothetical protein
LLGVTVGFSVAQPGVLLAVPFVLMALLLPPYRFSTTILAGVLAFLAFGGPPQAGLWYVERGWALLLGGWFVALTLRWPTAAFSGRALGAVAGAAGVAATILAVGPGEWNVLTWQVTSHLRTASASWLEALRLIRGEEGIPEALVEAAYRTIEVHGAIFPALMGLASMSALGATWWLYVRLSQGRDDGVKPLANFRFNDQLMWVLIAGLVMVLIGWGEGWSLAGTNTLVFMGALYAVRGAAVILWLYGGFNLLGVAVFLVGLLLAAPVIVGAALFIGIGDTWLDLRSRAVEAQDGR